MNQICVWSSRHAPTTAHRAALEGYDIRHLPARHINPATAWLDIFFAAGNQPPALVMLITSRHIYFEMILHIQTASPETVIIYPLMDKPYSADDSEWKWNGRWKQITVVKRGKEIIPQRSPWSPGAVRR